ncbi:hypothetical protein [Bradyrhizobium zhanjiangense]|uniref:Uncharacterized protein n=1 Tax=Bradyrhizobium zhanjiangense TaxID=1325107 RepID=A0A4Q0Q8D8_9BRAD|nr:hypothetical protein [Bradyrhizobium zhanjiangense]RXG85341.1 hypothetical protein EAS61_36435 [Bradyrhizobium zhanjiangense]
MRHDRGQEARLLNGLVIVPACNIGANALLPSLEDDNAHHPGFGPLLLDDLMELPLHRVELERHQPARLRPDLQVVLREILQISIKPLGMIQGAADRVCPVRQWISCPSEEVANSNCQSALLASSMETPICSAILLMI